MKKNYILLFFLLIFSGQLAGQYRWEAGVVVGLANYQGDLVEGTLPIFKEGNLSLGIGGRYLLNYNWALRGNILFGRLTGDDFNASDPDRVGRAVSFENPFTEASIRIEWEPFGEQHYLSLSQSRSFFSPYVFAGPALSFTNPKLDFSRTKSEEVVHLTNIERDQNENFFRTRFVVVTGLGIKYDINDLWVVGFELGMRYAFTDYLDGVSHAGNGDKRDWYSFGGISLFHRLPGTERAGE